MIFIVDLVGINRNWDGIIIGELIMGKGSN